MARAYVTCLGALGVWLAIGLFFLRAPFAPDLPFAWGGAAALIGAAALSGHSLYRAGLLRPMLWALAVSAVAETFGLLTGWPFGHYRYLPAAGPVLPGGLPLAIPAAWLVLLLAARSLLLPLRFPSWLHAAGVALLVTGMDLAVDPIAVHRLGMWAWPDGGPYYGIPLQNFAGWFLVAFLAAYPLGRRAPQSDIPAKVGALLMLFFFGAGVGHDLWLPSAIALGFAGALAVHALRHRGDHSWAPFRT